MLSNPDGEEPNDEHSGHCNIVGFPAVANQTGAHLLGKATDSRHAAGQQT